MKSEPNEWIYALQKAEVRPEFKAKGIKEAGEKLTLLHLSQEERYAYERYIGDIRISRSTLESSFVEGVFQGREQGRAEGEAAGLAKGKAEGRAEGEMKAKIEMVRSLYQLGISLEQISLATKLSSEEVAQILKA